MQVRMISLWLKTRKTELSKWQKTTFLVVIIALVLSAILFAPAVQNFILSFAEKFVLHREFRRPEKWTSMINDIGLCGVLLFTVMFFLLRFVIVRLDKFKCLSAKERAFCILSWCYLALCWLALDFYLIRFYPYYLDSDLTSDVMLLPKLVTEEKRLVFSDNWFYSTELRVLYPHLVFAFLFRFSNNWFLVRMLGSNIVFLLVTLSVYYLCSQLNSKKYFPFVAGTLLLPFSAENFIFLSGILYNFFIATSFLTLALCIDLLKTKSKRRFIILSALAALLSVFSAMNGLRQILVLFLPLFSASAFLFFYNYLCKRQSDKRYLHLLIFSAVLLVFAFIGLKINGILGKFYNFVNFNYVSWNALTGERVFTVIQGWLDVLGYTGGFIYDVLATPKNLCVFVILVFVVVYIIRVVKFESEVSFEYRFLACFFVFTFLVMSFLYLFTNISYYARYFVPVSIFVPLVLFLAPSEIRFVRSWWLKTIFFCALFAFSSSCVYYWHCSNWSNSPPPSIKVVAEWLVDNDYTEGYSTYWNGNIMTELSNGKIEVWVWSDSILKVGEISEWLQRKDHLTRHPSGKVFVLISQNEKDFAAVYGKEFVKCLDDEHLVFNDLGYLIYGWDDYELLPLELRS